ATPQLDLLEARRLLEVGDGNAAVPLLEKLEEGLNASDQLVRLRYLAAAYNMVGQPKQAFPIIERAQRMADLLENAEESIRRKALRAAGIAKANENEGDLEAAIQYNLKSLQAYEELGLLDQVACTLDNAAMLYAEYGNRERANDCLRRAAALAQQTKRDGTLASIRATEAEILAKTDPARGLDAAQEALRFARKVGQPDAEVRALVLIGELRM